MTMHILKQKLVRTILIEILAIGLFIVLVLTTNPYRLPLALLVVPFVLIFIVFYQGLILVSLKSKGEYQTKKQKLIATIFASSIITLALLQSIRQLSVRDLIIIIVLAVGLSLYLRRIDL